MCPAPWLIASVVPRTDPLPAGGNVRGRNVAQLAMSEIADKQARLSRPRSSLTLALTKLTRPTTSGINPERCGVWARIGAAEPAISVPVHARLRDQCGQHHQEQDKRENCGSRHPADLCAPDLCPTKA